MKMEQSWQVEVGNKPYLWLFVAPSLLLAAHVMAGIALLIFGQRVDDLPISPISLGIYLAATAISGIAFLIEVSQKRQAWPLTRKLLLLSVPTFISLVLTAALWLTPSLGNAPYAPWKVGGDSGSVFFLNLIFIFCWIIIAILYGSYGYLLTGGIIQLAVYFTTQEFPFWSLLPCGLTGLLIVGGILVAARKEIAPDFQPSPWVAVLLLTAVGSFTFYIAWSQLPENGMVLGWTETLTRPARQVPINAWNWTRPAAQILMFLAVVAVPLSGIAHWLTSRKK